MFCAETIAIISGKPSGTAMTIMMTASMTASTTAFTGTAQFEKYAAISAPLNPLSMKKDLKMKATAIAIPPI